MEKEELRARLKEELRKKYPKAVLTDTPEGIEVKTGTQHERYYLDKLLWEINQTHPSGWQKLIDLRVGMRGMMTKVFPKLIGFAPRTYPKSGMENPKTGRPLTREELEKGGMIILGETPMEWAILAGETEDAYISIPRKILLDKYGFTEQTLDELVAKWRKKLEEMGI
jgi:hypothetical protein